MNPPVSTIRTLIIDDEPVACEFLSWMLKQDPDIEILAACSNGKAAFHEIQAKRPDLIFLDIQMPEVDGFMLLQSLKIEERPYLIFVTAFDQYAVRAFEVQALDYLLKPFNQKRLQKALKRAKEQIFGQKQLALLKKGAAQDVAIPLQRLEVKVAGRLCYVPVAEVSWIEAADQYSNIHCASNCYLLRVSMSWLEKNLDPKQFVRIHRSIIVNVNHVSEAVLDREKGSYLLLKSGKKLRISRRRIGVLRRSLSGL